MLIGYNLIDSFYVILETLVSAFANVKCSIHNNLIIHSKDSYEFANSMSIIPIRSYLTIFSFVV